MRFNSVMVAPVRSLEVGDLIAHEFLGGVISGKITAIAHFAYQLTPEHKEYMRKKGLEVPSGEYVALGGESQCLVFGTFNGGYFNGGYFTRDSDEDRHMFLDYDTNVAVFPTHEKA